MADRRVFNPRLLLPLAILAAFVFTMIAIFVAVSYTPEPAGRPPAPVTTTATSPPSR